MLQQRHTVQWIVTIYCNGSASTFPFHWNCNIKWFNLKQFLLISNNIWSILLRPFTLIVLITLANLRSTEKMHNLASVLSLRFWARIQIYLHLWAQKAEVIRRNAQRFIIILHWSREIIRLVNMPSNAPQSFLEHHDSIWKSDQHSGNSIDLYQLAVIVGFAIPYVLLLALLPSLRKYRLQTLLIITLHMTTGTVLLTAIYHPSWTSASTKINAPYMPASTGKN